MRSLRHFLILLLTVALMAAYVAPVADAARLKDITHIQGVRSNQLIGYGLVVGLNGTGDDQKVLFTIQSLASMLSRMGVRVDMKDIRMKNVAAVVVTANLPPFSSPGSAIDVIISSIGNAKSLMGGTLLMTPLRAPDGQIYAVAQGPLILGGYSFGGGGAGATKNHPTVARIPDGALIEREVKVDLNAQAQVVLTLIEPDFTTAARIASGVNGILEGPYAWARDAGTVVVQVPSAYQSRVVDLIALIENLQVQTDRRARIVLNERTGTVVMGEDVRIASIAISHGNLKIQVSTQVEVSQPGPFSNGQTMAVPESNVQVVEEQKNMVQIPRAVTIGDLVMALNSLGVTPRDLIDIIQAIKAAGALEADVEVI